MSRCSCGRGCSMEGKRSHARWASDACREWKKRRDRGLKSVVGRPQQEAWREEDRGFETPCHIWLLAVNRQGYPTVSRDGKTRRAHKWRYEKEVGPVPEGRELHHRCEVILCVNPDHQQPVTRTEHVALHR